MCQVSHRHVFVFNGLSSELAPTQKNTIEYIDLGNCEPKTLQKARWEQVTINQSDFIMNDPRASAALNGSEMIVFGGLGNYTYQLDLKTMLASKSVSSMAVQGSAAGNSVNVTKLIDSKLLGETKFCQNADFSVRTFGNYLYAVDGQMQVLHVFSIKDKMWNYSSLKDLGIN